MKRARELKRLSEDHHHALVLARKAKRAGAGEAASAASGMWAEVESRFEKELEPHFRIEESLLAPALEARGEAGLVSRLREDHAAIRRIVDQGGGRSAADLRRFGDLLERHIRFEERELFEVAQRVMGPEALRAVEEACEARGDRG